MPLPGSGGPAVKGAAPAPRGLCSHGRRGADTGMTCRPVVLSQGPRSIWSQFRCNNRGRGWEGCGGICNSTERAGMRETSHRGPETTTPSWVPQAPAAGWWESQPWSALCWPPLLCAGACQAGDRFPLVPGKCRPGQKSSWQPAAGGVQAHLRWGHWPNLFML